MFSVVIDDKRGGSKFWLMKFKLDGTKNFIRRVEHDWYR